MPCRSRTTSTWCRPAHPARSGCTARCSTGPGRPPGLGRAAGAGGGGGRPAGPRRDPRALADRHRGERRPGARLAAPRRPHLHRLGPGLDRSPRPLLVHDRDAGRAVLRAHCLRTRAPEPALHAGLPPGGRGRPVPRHRRPGPALDAAGHPGRDWPGDGVPVRRATAGRGGDGVPGLPAAPALMSELFWPGDERAGELFSDAAFRAAMVRVESAWVDTELLVPTDELDVEPGGNPVIPLLELLRKANPEV